MIPLKPFLNKKPVLDQCQWRSQPDNFVLLGKFEIIIHFFRNELISINTKMFAYIAKSSGGLRIAKSSGGLRY